MSNQKLESEYLIKRDKLQIKLYLRNKDLVFFWTDRFPGRKKLTPRGLRKILLSSLGVYSVSAFKPGSPHISPLEGIKERISLSDFEVLKIREKCIVSRYYS